MSAPLVISLRDGSVWERRAVTAAGVALYALAGSCKCPEYLMASESELAAQGIAGTADALPRPVGPQMPEFPPPPETELEMLHAERARLQGLLAEAVADAHRARRERDGMREQVSEPYGCTHCGIAKRGHARRWTTGVGMHAWEAPSQGQIAERMKARRTVRLAARAGELGRLRAQVAALLEERRVTNEALSDAAEQLRADRDRIAELEAWKAADEQVQPHHEATAAANLRYIAKLETRARRVRFLHVKHSDSEHCQLDGESWPCSTITALGADGIARRIVPVQALREDEPAAKCRCDEPDADPYECEADDCTGEFSELNPFGGGPVQGHDAKVSRTCETCGWKTSVWHVADGSAEEELHGHSVRVHGGVAPEVSR
jgi:hypothetical protein